jgi:hypothetical protein
MSVTDDELLKKRLERVRESLDKLGKASRTSRPKLPTPTNDSL